jgi:phospholipase C
LAAPQTATPSSAHIKTVFIILMENHNWTGAKQDNIKGSRYAPYINNTLVPMGSHAEQYFNPPTIHPSLPNYLWLEAGTNFGILDDNPPSDHPLTTTEHLVTLLHNAGISWKAYEENISGTDCPLVSSGLYAVKHNPFVYFTDVTNNLDPSGRYCIQHVRPFTELAGDLQKGPVAQYNFITPNLCDDMHDKCKPLQNQIQQGDTWLSQNVPMILNYVFQHAGALFVTWDEAASDDGPIGMIVLSPFAKGNSYENFTYYDHGSTLRTFEEIFGVSPPLGDAESQMDLSDLFSVFP